MLRLRTARHGTCNPVAVYDADVPWRRGAWWLGAHQPTYLPDELADRGTITVFLIPPSYHQPSQEEKAEREESRGGEYAESDWIQSVRQNESTRGYHQHKQPRISAKSLLVLFFFFSTTHHTPPHSTAHADAQHRHHASSPITEQSQLPPSVASSTNLSGVFPTTTQH